MKFLAAVMPPPDIYQYEPGSSEKKSGYIARGWNWAQNQSDQGTGKKRAVENLPFSSLHKQIVIHLIYFVVLWLNDFLATQSISEKHSPRKCFNGQEVDFNKDWKAVLRFYVKSSKYATVKNTMKSRTYDCISMGASGDLQSSQPFSYIYTGRILKYRTIKEFFIPDMVVRCMNYWGKKSKNK